MKNKKILLIILLFFLAVLSFLSIKSAGITTSLQNEGYPMLQANIENTKNWDTYKNEKYKFEIKYPKGGNVVLSDTGLSDYIRIQNYNGVITDDGYYVEIYIYDHNANRKQPCPGLVKDYSKVLVGQFTGYRGKVESGGEAALYIQALCVNSSNADFLIQASENVDRVSNDIVNSLTITP